MGPLVQLVPQARKEVLELRESLVQLVLQVRRDRPG